MLLPSSKGVVGSSRRNLQTLLALLLASSIFLLLYRFWARKTLTQPTTEPSFQDDIRIFDIAHLSPQIEYSRCELIVVQSDKVTTFPEHLSGSLTDFKHMNLENGYLDYLQSDLHSSEPIKVLAPILPARPDVSHIVFGLATTIRRLEDSLETLAHWAANTQARLVVLVEAEGPNMNQVLKRATSLKINLEIVESSEPYDDRYFSLVRALYERRQTSQWAAFIDDDTFFPSISALVAQLATYDSSLPYYVGSLSEDFVQMSAWGYMAYGGAGIFLSMPLLSQINTFYDECHAEKATGDRMLSRCIFKHTSTKLSLEPSLHQVDLHGDCSGFYESGRPQPLSVHHWKSWFNASMTGLAQVAAICGDACLLHRFRFADDWFLVNGFSAIKYSVPLADGDVSMEKTWDDFSSATDDSYAHTLAPLRPKDEGKISLKLELALREDDCVRQFYVQRQEEGIGIRVLEVVWRKGG